MWTLIIKQDGNNDFYSSEISFMSKEVTELTSLVNKVSELEEDRNTQFFLVRIKKDGGADRE